MTDETEAAVVSSATAYFATYEDLSSRLVLLPFNDDDCTGAKVCSHEIVPPSSEHEKQSEVLTTKDQLDNNAVPDSTDGNGEAKSASNNRANAMPEAAVSDGVGNNPGGKKKKRNKKKRKKKQTDNCHDVNMEDSNSKEETSLDEDPVPSVVPSVLHKTRDVKCEEAVPVGYVLIKLSGRIACMEHSVEELHERDFTEILSLLRDVAYPITLTFVSPECLADGRNTNVDDMECSKSLNAATSGETTSDTSTDTKDEVEATSTKDAEDLNNHSILASREEAAKYAAQAASELRGRLTRWGFQAATKAAEAAQAVQEIREERQRKIAEEHDKLDSCEEKKCDVSSKCDEDESETPNSVDNESQHCHIFLQSATGFVKLGGTSATTEPTSSSYMFSPQKKTTVVTNMSVITVRLSEEKACPIGSNGYKFQWYRSKNEYTAGIETSSIEWCTLHGADYPAYQPSVSDIGYLLSCLVNFREGDSTFQRCILPLPITTEQSLFESAKSSLLKVGGCATFGSLKDASGSVFRLRVFVDSNNETDSISKSYIIFDEWVGSEFKQLHQEHQSLSAVRARSDPSRPRGFEIILESISQPNRYVLDAPNRNTRESLLIALGLASFTGSLSSLTTETTLLQYSDEFEVPVVVETSKEIPSDHTQSPPNTDEKVISSKNLYAIQLEAQMKDMQAELEAKTTIISKLQQKLTVSTDEKKKTERELLQARSKADDLFQCQQQVEEKNAVISEQERSIKSLHNEKAVLAASVEMRDGKINAQSVRIVELEDQLADALRQVEEVRKSESEQVRARLEAAKAKENAETAALIEAMKKEEDQFKAELKGAQSIIEELNHKYASTKDSSAKTKDELDKMRVDAKKLKMERNTLKNKNEGLVREISKLQAQLAIKPKPIQPVNEAEMRTLSQTINQLQLHNNQLQDEITALRSEKRELGEELQVTRSAHKQSARYLASQQPATPNREALRMRQQCEDLESMISNLKDLLDAKEMQINTFKQINETVLRELDEARIAKK